MKINIFNQFSLKKSKAILLFVFLFIGFVAQYTNILAPNGSDTHSPLGVKKSEAWYDNGYLYKKQLTIDGTQVPGGSTLNNFPVLVSITDSQLRTTANGGRVTNANGYDIIFTDDAEGTKLSHEIESYNATTGTIVMWVKVLNLYSGSNTNLYMYYGNSSISTSQENKTDVWGSNYKGVWHMDDGSGASVTDSTSNADTFTKKSTTEPADATGKIGQAQNWDGVNDYATMVDNANISPTVAANTFSVWVNITGFPAASPYFMQLLGDDSSTNSPSAIWRFGASNTLANNKRIGININDGSNHDNANGTDLTTSTWTYLTITTDGTNVKYYINGALNTTNAYTYIPRATSQPWYMGAYGTTARYFKGIMDEMRVYYGAALSANWIQTEYNNQNNQGSGAGKFFSSVGGEQAFPVPAVANYGAILVDDTTAVLTAGIMSYGASSNGYFRYGISPTYTTGSACSSLPNTTTNASSGSNNGNYFPRSAQVNGLAAGATYVYCFQSTSLGSPGYSAVTSFTLSATASTACSLFPGSGIASASDSTTVKGFLGTSKLKGTLLYKGSVNGWTPTNFHTAVDNQGEAIILIRNSSNGKVIGAYTPKSWNSSGSWTQGAGALLFSISDNYKLAQVNYADTMMLGQSLRAPYISGGASLNGSYNVDLNSANAWSTANNASYWQIPSSQGAFTYLAGASPFTADEVEAYALSVCTAAPPTVSTPTAVYVSPTSETLGGTLVSAGTQSVTDRGVCYSTTDTTPGFASQGVPEAGVTCVSASATSPFTVTVNSLANNTHYYYRAYAYNSVGYGYDTTTPGANTFDTPNVNPTGVDTNSPTGVNSYYVTLSGVANPNSASSTGHFRVYPTNPGNCNNDSSGANIRYPQSPANDVVIGADTSPHTFTYTIPPSANTFLDPNTQYWYCSFAINTYGTTGGATVATFKTADGPASPCDPPTTGNLTVPSSATCNLNGNFNGVDTGTGTTNNASLVLSPNSSMTIGPTQQIAFGSFQLQKPQSSLTIARGGSLKKGGVFVHDKDGDGIIDDQTQYVGSTASAATEFVRRNLIATNYNYAYKIASAAATVDCNPNNAYTFRTIDGLITDADNDGYKTSAAPATQCVGSQSVINGRNYFKDSSNVSSWLPDGQKLSASTDCQDDPNGAPCGPVNASGTNATDPTAAAASTTQINLAWGVNSIGGAIPAVASYDVYSCGLNQSGCASPSIVNVSNATFSYNNSGITCSTSPSYYYRIVAKNGAGNTQSNIFSGVTSACASIPTVTTSAASSISVFTADVNSTINPNNASTDVSYRYGTTNTGNCSTLPLTQAGPTGLTGSSNLSGATTKATLTGLTQKTTYYFCAVATNSAGTNYGAISNFTTLGPTVQTTSASNIQVTTATINGNYGAYGGVTLGVWFRYWSTNPGSTCSDSGGTRAPASGNNSSTSSVGPFSTTRNLTGLADGTTYYYCLFGSDSNGSYNSGTPATFSTGLCGRDADGDGYGVSSPTAACGTSGYVSNYNDCYDYNGNQGSSAHPGQTSYFTFTRGFAGNQSDSVGNTGNSYDFDCDNSTTMQYGAEKASGYFCQDYWTKPSTICSYNSASNTCDAFNTTYTSISTGSCGETYDVLNSAPISNAYSNSGCTTPLTVYSRNNGAGQHTQGCR